MQAYRGGCSCGAVRFALSRPLWTVACHCDACKKRTGTAYGMSIVVEEGDVAEFTGKTKTFTRTGESGKPVHYEFCPDCGTTIRWRVDLIGGRQVYAVGALDDPKTIEIMSEMYTDFALPHARLGRELSCPGAPDNEFRKAAMAKANSLR